LDSNVDDRSNYGEAQGVAANESARAIFWMRRAGYNIFLWNHVWCQVPPLLKFRVCGQRIHRASAIVQIPIPHCAQSKTYLDKK